MLLVSWNVAGWSTTSAAIREAFGSVKEFLDHLGADILCLQEAKIPLKRLRNEADGVFCGAADRPGFPIDGYESFWCCCADRAMNGVTTFARTGTTLQVDDKPFRDEALDREGRCLVTYHSHFVVVNVYVPYGQGGRRQSLKDAFQLKLSDLISRLESDAKLPVILAGDMNCSYRTQDCHFLKRRLHIPKLLQALGILHEEANNTNSAEMGAASSISARWPLVTAEREALWYMAPYITSWLVAHSHSSDETAVAAPNDVNSATLALKQRSASSSTAPRDVILNELRTAWATFEQVRAVPPKQADDNAEQNGIQEGKTVDLRPSVWVDDLCRNGGSIDQPHNAKLFLVSECFGLPAHPESDGRWIRERILGRLHMLDTFVVASSPCGWEEAVDPYLLPGVPREHYTHVDERFACPFTCWDQSRNRRYENEGNRIDYIFVSRSLVTVPTVRNAPGCTDAHEEASTNTATDVSQTLLLSEFSGSRRAFGIRRVTANGAYAPVSFLGGGLPPLPADMKMLPFERSPAAPHQFQGTGLFISPPQFSDHIGVTFTAEVPVHCRPPRSTVIDPNQAMFRRRSGNVLSMFMRCGAVKTHVAPTVEPTTLPIASAAAAADVAKGGRNGRGDSLDDDDDVVDITAARRTDEPRKRERSS